MTALVFGLDALRVAAILGASFVVGRLLRGRAASLRRLVRATAFACALLLPLAAHVAPGAAVARPTLPAIVARPFAEPASEAGAVAPRAVWREASGQALTLEVVPVGGALLVVWALVAAALLVRLLRDHLAARRIARRADPRIDAAWRAALVAVAANRASRIELRVTAEIDTPSVVGVFSPVVLVPRASRSWSAERRRAVLAHELAHVDAHDGLNRLVASVVCALHWFDPLAWIAARALRFDQEEAADAAALEGGVRPSTYAADLVEIARDARRSSAASVGMVTASELERRIRAVILEAPLSPPSAVTTLSAVAALVGSASLLACTQPSTAESIAPLAAPSSAGTTSAAVGVPRGADPKLQAIVDEEIARLVADASPDRAAVIALDPATGRVLAEAGRDHGAPADLAFGATFVPGSTFKLVTIAAALDAGTITRETRIDCAPRAYGDKTLNDSSLHGSLSLGEVVALSSNVGVARIFDLLGEARFLAAARKMHFGEAPAGVSGAESGAIPKSLAPNTFEGALSVIGEGGAVASPAQIAAAYAAIAAGGVYHAPSRGAASPGERVVSAEAAATMIGLLDGAVNGEHATGAAARVDGVRIAGKTGTADFTQAGTPHVYATFVGMAPREAPRVVVLVSADFTGKRPEQATGGSIAAPVFARIVKRSL